MLLAEEESRESGFRSSLSRWLGPDPSGSAGGSLPNDPRNVNVGLRRRVAVISVLFLCAVGAVTWYLVNLGQQRLIEIKALDVAEVVARLSTSSRSVYAERVVNKLQRDRIGYASETYMHEPGNVPLPAQFLKFVGEHASKDNGGLYHYRPLSKWNLARNQGLSDSFQRWVKEIVQRVEGNPPFVLASDYVYLWRNLTEHKASAMGVFSAADLPANIKNQARMIELAGSIDRVIPGHDALQFQRFPMQGRVAKIK